MKKLLGFKLLMALILLTLLLSGCVKENMMENSLNISQTETVKHGKIPYLPLSYNNVLCIELNGYSQEGKHNNNRLATEEEMAQIVKWLNNIKNYDSVIEIPKYGNDRPEPSNIAIFTKRL